MKKVFYWIMLCALIAANDVIFHTIGVNRGVRVACGSMVEDFSQFIRLTPEDKGVLTDQCVEDMLSG